LFSQLRRRHCCLKRLATASDILRPPFSSSEKMNREKRENRAFCSRNSEERESWNENEENPHYSLFIGAPRSRARGCTTCYVPSFLLAFWSQSNGPRCLDLWSDVSCRTYLTVWIDSSLTQPTQPTNRPGSVPFALSPIFFAILHTP